MRKLSRRQYLPWMMLASLWLFATMRGAEERGKPAPLYPDPQWQRTTDFASVNISAERLEAYRAWLTERCGDTWGAVIIKGGYLVFEGHGAKGDINEQYDCGSIRKSLQSAVLGAALLQKRLASLDENAIPYWKDPWPTRYENDRTITFRQFVTFHDRWNEEAPAGTFHYNNCGATAGGACVAGLFREVRGPRPQGMAEVAQHEIMERIGADWRLTYANRDFDAEKPGDSGPKMVLNSNPLELAKLGYLWLHRGVWKKERLFSEDYYREAMTDWAPHTGSTNVGFIGHYGYWWFLNRGKHLLPDVPEDAYYNLGNGMPKRATGLLVIPSQDLVAVLSMERLSDDKKWDIYIKYAGPDPEGVRSWTKEVAKLHTGATGGKTRP